MANKSNKIKITGLDCGHCAMHLEEQLNKDKRLKDVKVDFVNASIYYSGDISLNDLASLISSIEKDVWIVDDNKYVYYLEGLDCANCANEFESILNKQDFVNEAVVDFVNKKLVLSYDISKYDELNKIALSFEDGVILKQDNDNNIKDNYQSRINKELLISIVLSLLIVCVSFLIEDDLIKKIILIISFIIASYDILFKVVKNLLKANLFDENFLMGIAGIAAFTINQELEAIAIMVFYKVGEFFQDLAVNKSRYNIKELMNLQVETANLLVNDNIEVVDPKTIKIDDVVIVKAGERIPLDAMVIEGSSYLDTKALTGESNLVKVKINDNVLSGSINQESVLKIKITKEYKDSTVAKILDLVENSSLHKAPTENFISKFARVYTPIVVLIALLVSIIPPILFQQSFDVWLYKALIFLVISCPCALVISIPLGFFGGIGNASKNGILVKGANYLEALNDVSSVVFDKTGTLTKGNFVIKEIVSVSKYNQEEILEILAYAEYYSNHPLAMIVSNTYHKDIDINLISDYNEVAGQGIKVKYQDDYLLAGNDKLLINNSISFDKVNSPDTIIYLVRNNEYIAHVIFADEIKTSAIEGINKLKDININDLIMLSGDNNNIVNDVASKLALSQAYGELLPQDKVRIFSELKEKMNKKQKIVFVGDGINDAPVLALSDIGISMGGVGSDAAIEASDVVIMNDDINKISQAILIARKTKKIVKQNIIIAFAIKILALSLGLLGLATIWEAVIADVGVALIAIFNAMRVLKS